MSSPQPWWRRPLWPWSRLSPWQGWIFGAVLATVTLVVLTRWLDDHSIVPWLILVWQGARAALKVGRSTEQHLI